MITDYFALEPLIIARLKAEVPELKAVSGNADREYDETSHLPSAIVVHDGYNPVSRNGSMQTVDQRWAVVILIATPNDESGAKARAEAGPLLMKIKSALVGWSAAQGALAFALAPSESETYTEEGIALFPITFTSRIII